MDQTRRDELLRNTTHSDSDVVKEAWAVLAPLVPSDKDVRDAALRNTTHSDSDVVKEALAVLAPLVPSDKDVRDAALRNTTHSAWYVVKEALAVLAPLVPSDKDVRDAALRNTTHSDSDVVKEAWAVLGFDMTSNAAVDAHFASVITDYRAILERSPYEIPALQSALSEGLVDGETYHGECGCLLTTLARARGLRYDQIPGVIPDVDRPSEQFFLKIKKGDTVRTSGWAVLASRWASEFETEFKARQ